jgi:site-specific recombinase XerD
MLDQFYGPDEVDRLRRSAFAPWLDAYVARLHERGNARRSIRRYVHSVLHFGRWLQRRHLATKDINQRVVLDFLQTHLPRCRCTHPVARELVNVRPALLHLLRLPAFADNAPSAPPSPADALLAEFDLYLLQVAGLTEESRRGRRRCARDFLQEVSGGGPVNWAKLRPQDVAAFFHRCAERLRPRSVQAAATCVRSFLRFLRTTGQCDRDLTAAIPSVSQRRLASVPRYMSEKQLRVFLRQFKRGSPTGRRDYAMALCLVEMGLRAGEVAALRLDDIDWRAGTLRVVGGKNRRDRELPLPQAIGEAFTAYLQQGRPETASRHLFVRHTLFKGQAVSTTLVRCIMGRALKEVPGYELFKGAHVLRHTAATRLFQRGVPLKVVADLLGHRSIDTTQIYTKVDLPSLANVALPWPEAPS